MVYAINAISLSVPGAGFFDFVFQLDWGLKKIVWITVMLSVQCFYFGWNLHCVLTPVRKAMTPITQQRPYIEGEFAVVHESTAVAHHLLPAESPLDTAASASHLEGTDPDTLRDNVLVDDQLITDNHELL
jgi:hypothetical protein